MSAPPSTAKTADTMIGRKIGHYSITRRIGQGGMGVVYEAVHDKIKQRVAIKVLHKEMSQDEKVVQRFFNEANAISMAQHSSIVKIMDYGQLDDGTAYIMMEFLDGEPLLSRIERAQEHGTGLGLHMVVELGRQTATALGLIHEKNIVHRDLKPENIFIVPDTVAPLGERVKLLDFGIAKFLDGPVRKTTVGMILGTPLYMSPEQCEGREDLSPKVDVYALGAMLFEMVTGRLPFQADTAAALMRQHMFKAAPRLRDYAQTAPAELDDLIAEMLRKEPADRPVMTDIARRLEALIPHVTGKNTPLVEGVQIPKVARKTGISEADPLAATVGDSSRHSGPSSRPLGSSGSQSGLSQSQTGSIGSEPKSKLSVPILLGAIGVLLVGLLLAIFALPPKNPAPPQSAAKIQTPPVPPEPPQKNPQAATSPSETSAKTTVSSADPKNKAAAEPVADTAPADSAAKQIKKKPVKVGKPVKPPGTESAAAAPPPPVVEKTAKPTGKTDKTGGDIGVWRDP